MARLSEDRAFRSIDRYLQEISKTPLLSPEEEVELARKIKQGDDQALQLLISSNLLFVVSVAKKYQNKGVAFGDLINEGNLGLMKAAKRFDESRGFRFISYAVWWIRQAILQALADQTRVIRLPLNRVSALTRIAKVSSELEQRYEREANITEIADRVDLTAMEVAKTLQDSRRTLSMDSPLNNTPDTRLLDVIQNEHELSPDSGLVDESLNIEIERALSTLTKREATVVRMYYGLGYEHPMKLEEIGDRFNLTRERIRQIKEKALRRLRYISRSSALRAYLD